MTNLKNNLIADEANNTELNAETLENVTGGNGSKILTSPNGKQDEPWWGQKPQWGLKQEEPRPQRCKCCQKR